MIGMMNTKDGIFAREWLRAAVAAFNRCSGKGLSKEAFELWDWNDEEHTAGGCQCPRRAELGVLGQEGRSVCGTRCKQREAGKWESRVYLKFNGWEIHRDVQLCLVWKFGRRLGDDDRFGNKTCQAAIVWAEESIEWSGWICDVICRQTRLDWQTVEMRGSCFSSWPLC